MTSSRRFIASLFTALGLLSACSSDSGSGSGNADNNPNKPAPQNRVNWTSVPSEFNPTVEDLNFNTAGVERIKLNFFGFDDDVEVVYSKDLTAGAGLVRIYKVWKKSASFGSLQNTTSGNTVSFYSNGSYSCSIKVSNGNITDLEGGCYVRMQVFLPEGAQIEVYNVNQLLTKRFIPIDTATFLKDFDSAMRTDDKLTVIDTYIASYEGTGKSPTLSAKQLGDVIEDFIRKDEKFRALRRLHMYVSDRQNLNAMIEDVFSYFDREEARNIVGL